MINAVQITTYSPMQAKDCYWKSRLAACWHATSPMKCNCKAAMELQKAANATNKISQNWPAGRAGQCQTRQMLAVVFYVHELHNLVLFSSPPKRQNFQDFPSHRIFGRMPEALNINKK